MPAISRERRAQLSAALQTLSGFIGPAQCRAVRDSLHGEEKEFFVDKLVELAGIVSTMPHTYQQDGKGEDAVVYLHYFAGGSANWWLTEKDTGTPGEPGQHQAFGLANFYGGPDEPDAELGYISIVELLEAGAELDFYFQPRTLRQLRARENPSAPAVAPVAPQEITSRVTQFVPADPLAAARRFLENL